MQMNICVVESSKSSSVIPSVHVLSFESISVAEEIMYLQQNCYIIHILSICTDADLH